MMTSPDTNTPSAAHPVPDSPCDLCSEIENNWTLAAGRSHDEAGGRVSSLLIQRNSFFDTIAGLGALAPGYALLVPRHHVRSTGELDEPSLQKIYQAAWAMADRISEVFDRSSVILEHGSSGDPRLPGGACIAHAHIHILPLERSSDPLYFVPPGSRLIEDVGQLIQAARRRSNYYYQALTNNSGYLSMDINIGQQYARRKWADQLGKSSEWDWAAAPHLEIALETATVLRDLNLDLVLSEDLESSDEDIRETIAAYNFYADNYARRTQEFPAASALPNEIDWLAAETEGTILDAGCGAGRDTLRFSTSGRTVVALDASRRLLQHVPSRPNIDKIVGDVRRTKLRSESVGAIWCSAVLLHLRPEKAMEALKELYRVLVADGLMEISVKGGTGHRCEPIPGHRYHRRHFYFYTAQDMTRMASNAGFEIVKTWEKEESDSADSRQRWIKLILRKKSL